MDAKKTSVKKSTAKRKAPIKKSARKTVENNQSSRVIKKSSGPRPNNGGARSGAGRKVGAATKKTREIADKLAADGEQSPLEYLLETMRTTPEKIRSLHKSGEIDTAEFTIRMMELIKRRDNAAEKAAPYMHARLSSIEATVKDAGHEAWLLAMKEAGL
jgi:hypothetical protein